MRCVPVTSRYAGCYVRQFSTVGSHKWTPCAKPLNPQGRSRTLRARPGRKQYARSRPWPRSRNRPTSRRFTIWPISPFIATISSRRGVAQPGSALASGARGRRFKSSHPDQHPCRGVLIPATCFPRTWRSADKNVHWTFLFIGLTLSPRPNLRYEGRDTRENLTPHIPFIYISPLSYLAPRISYLTYGTADTYHYYPARVVAGRAFRPPRAGTTSSVFRAVDQRPGTHGGLRRLRNAYPRIRGDTRRWQGLLLRTAPQDRRWLADFDSPHPVARPQNRRGRTWTTAGWARR